MKAFVLAWRISRFLPVTVIRLIAGLAGYLAWLLRADAVVRLEANLHRVTGLEGRAMRRLSRRAMSSAARYYAEALELPRVSGETIDARVRMVDSTGASAAITDDARVIIALSHSGNWDLIGAYASRHLAKVTAVAEVLKPRKAFEEFVAYREKLGMRILGHEGSATFRELIRITKTHGGVIALVADRDISGAGIPVTMWGHGVKVAAGPAALAIATDSQLVPLMVHYERLRGAARRKARSRWGSVMVFGPMITVPDGARREHVGEMTQAWVSFMADQIARHPEDWHMLQRFGWVS